MTKEKEYSQKEIEITISKEAAPEASFTPLEPEIETVKEGEFESRKSVFNNIIKWCIYIFVALMPLWFLPYTANILDFNNSRVNFRHGEKISRRNLCYYFRLAVSLYAD